MTRSKRHNLCAELTGSDWIVLSDYDEHIPHVLGLISSHLVRYSTSTILENEHLVWTVGDERTDFTTETSKFQAPRVCMNHIPFRIERITSNAQTMETFSWY